MQILINIDEEDYYNLIEQAKKYSPDMFTKTQNNIINGISLPKGHGRIMDVDKVIKKMEEREEKLKDDRSMWETAAVETALDMFGETIIEADKAGSEKER